MPQKGFWGVEPSLLDRPRNGRKCMPKVYDGIARTSLGGGLAYIGELGLMDTNLGMFPSDTDAGKERCVEWCWK
jgi:hypothetical protein